MLWKGKPRNAVTVAFRSGPYVAAARISADRRGRLAVLDLTAAVKLPPDVERDIRRAAAKYLICRQHDLRAKLEGNGRSD